MGGMMGGMGAQAAPMAVAPTVGRGGVVGNNLAATAAPVASPNLMGGIFKAMFDPEETAAMMAKQGLTPDEFMQNAAKDSLQASLQPQVGAASPTSKLGSVIAPQTDRQVASGQAPSSQVAQVIGSPSPILQGGQPVVGGGKPVVGGSPPVVGGSPHVSDFADVIGGGLGGDLGKLIDNSWLRAIFGAGGAGGPGTKPGVGEVISPAPAPAVPSATQPIVPPVSTAGTVPPSAPSVVAPPVAPDANLIPPIVPYGERSPNVEAPEITTGGTQLGGAVGSPAIGMGKNPIYNEFMKTIQEGGVKNPNALAAIAATGESESGFREKNVFGSWNDPSASGQAGTAGGVMSWRAERFNAMKKFVKDNGGDPSHPSPALQAKFLLAEDPDLIKKLEAAKSPEEAMKLMNNAWRFKGYDQEGGEAARRIALARNLAGSFGGKPGEETTTSTTEAPTTPAEKAKTVTDKLAELSDALAADSGGGGEEDRGPAPPGAVSPGRGSNEMDPNAMKLMLMLLSPSLGAGGIPTLTQLMSGAQKNA